MTALTRSRRLLVDPHSGYELNPARGYFSVVLAAGVTNLVTNPSIELATTGYTAVGGSIARVATQQRRGVYSLEVTPGAGVNNGAFFGTVSLVSGVLYWFSFDFKGQAGRPYKAYFATTGAAQLGAAVSWIANGRWQRIAVPYRETSTTTRRLYVTKDNHANAGLFYLDGLQCEANTWPTTYADGDQRGLIPNQTDYYWTGTPHASTSVRIAQSAAGGLVVSLKQVGFRVISIIGLGMGGLNNQFTPIATGGAFFQGTVVNDRQFTLAGEVSGPEWSELGMSRQALIDLFKPDRVTPDQPVLLLYQPCDDAGEPTGETLEIPCVFESDLSGRLDNLNQERLALQFRLYLPFVAREEGEAGAVLGYQTSLANADRILRRSPAGVWSRVGGASAFASNEVLEILPLADGRVAIGGSFINAGGLANADFFVLYDPATDTLAAANATPLNGAVQTILQKPNGDLLIGGSFTDAGGDVNADALCLMNIGTGAYSSINATPLAGGSTVYALVSLPDGNFAMGGFYTNAGGDTNADYLAKITNATGAFSAFNATPLGNTVYALRLRQDGNLLVGGAFENAGGIATADEACLLNLSTNAFETVSAVSLATATIVYVIESGLDGAVYLGGSFLNGAGIAEADYGVINNGIAYSALSTGFNNEVRSLTRLKEGILWGGIFTRAGPLSLFDRFAIWNGSAFVRLEVDLPGTPIGYSSARAPDGSVYIGHDTAGTSIVAALTTVTNNGTAKAYPRLKLTGPGTVFQIKNWTTGNAMWFNLTLLAGEVAVLDLSDPLNTTFESSVRGNLLGTILPGSSFDLFLHPGVNSIGLFIAGTTDVNTAAVMSWRKAHHSLDGALPARILP